MADTNLNIPVSTLMDDLHMTVTATGATTARVRIWMATRLMILAVRVGGFGGISVEVGNMQRQWWLRRPPEDAA